MQNKEPTIKESNQFVQVHEDDEENLSFEQSFYCFDQSRVGSAGQTHGQQSLFIHDNSLILNDSIRLLQSKTGPIEPHSISQSHNLSSASFKMISQESHPAAKVQNSSFLNNQDSQFSQIINSQLQFSTRSDEKQSIKRANGKSSETKKKLSGSRQAKAKIQRYIIEGEQQKMSFEEDKLDLKKKQKSDSSKNEVKNWKQSNDQIGSDPDNSDIYSKESIDQIDQSKEIGGFGRLNISNKIGSSRYYVEKEQIAFQKLFDKKFLEQQLISLDVSGIQKSELSCSESLISQLGKGKSLKPIQFMKQFQAVNKPMYMLPAYTHEQIRAFQKSEKMSFEDTVSDHQFSQIDISEQDSKTKVDQPQYDSDMMALDFLEYNQYREQLANIIRMKQETKEYGKQYKDLAFQQKQLILNWKTKNKNKNKSNQIKLNFIDKLSPHPISNSYSQPNSLYKQSPHIQNFTQQTYYPKLERINFQKNNIQDPYLITFAENAQKIPTLAQINFRSNSITDQGFIALLQNAHRLKNLKRIDLARNKITSQGFKYLGYYSQQFHQLQKIDFSSNQITSEGLISFAVQSKKQFNLRQIDLSKNQITCPGLIALAENGKHFPYLEQLILTQNQIGDDGFTMFANNSHKYPKLKRIQLQKNNITGRGFKAFALNGANFTQVQILNLNLNQIGDTGLRQFAENSRHFKKVRKIGFERNGITAESISLFAENAHNLQELFEINLHSNFISDIGIILLAQNGRNFKKLYILQIGRNNIADQGFQFFILMHTNFPELKKVFISHNPITWKSSDIMYEHRHSLEELEINGLPSFKDSYLKQNDQLNLHKKFQKKNENCAIF